jgi:hypothetical protein
MIIKIAPENPILWTGFSGVSAKGRENFNQMLKQACPEEILNQVQNDTFRVQHDNRVWLSLFVIPNQVLKQVQDLSISGSRFLVLRIWVLKPRPVCGVLYLNL